MAGQAKKVATAVQAKTLALAYHGFMVAMRDHDNVGRALWGSRLLETQEATGVELQDATLLRQVIHSANYDKTEGGR